MTHLKTMSVSAIALMAAGAFANATPAWAQDADDERAYLDGLAYRNIGPWRGGRATAIAGSAARPNTYFMGVTGGVFRTTNAGVSWEPVSDDDFATAPVGALDVAPSDPNVVVAGMGESPFRGVASSQGDGVYRSVDNGETWTHLGLEGTRQISSVRIHPEDPETFLVAAQGDSWAPSDARGVYKTTDGGETWRKTLAGENNTTGAIDLKYDRSNPRIVYAALWDHEREPWEVRSGGEGSGIWRSDDFGETWTELSEGLPDAMGKIGVAPSPAKLGRVYAIVEAADGEGGLYRSEDAGESWTQINSMRKIQARSWYYMHVFADPLDADTVYVLNAPMMKSIDGGKTFEEMPDRHGDHHDLWINPGDSKLIANANDGGGNISFDGGQTWSTLHNQPTAQFYRVIADNNPLYRVYAGQQDNSTVALRARAPDGSIGRDDYISVGGGESAHVAFDPDNPRYVYAGSYIGFMTEYDAETQMVRYITAYPELEFGVPPRQRRYRWNWNAPVIVSHHDPSVIYHAANHVFVTRDRGYSWDEYSPDLSRDEEDKQGPGGGPITNEVTEAYNTILALTESPFEQGVMWAGTDDGRLQITRDDGESWRDVTPRGVNDGMFNAIEVSPHDAGTAYVAYTRYKMADRAPYIYRTTNYGRSWSRIDGDLPDEAFVRVVREDTERRGLLFAGTERGVYFSLNDGDSWRELRLNMPVVPINDLRVHGRDLVIATAGRAFWILDDIAPLRELNANVEGASAHLFAPSTAYRFEHSRRSGGNGGDSPNPPAGAVIYYALEAEPDLEETTIKLEILDAEGTVVRTLKTDEEKGVKGGGEGVTFALPAEAGVNRIAWDMRGDPITAVPGYFSVGGGEAQIVPGYVFGPGDYTVRLIVGEETIGEQPLRLEWDPRVTFDADRTAEQQEMAGELYAMLDELFRSVNALRGAKEQAEARKAVLKEADADSALIEQAKAVGEAVDEWEKTVITVEREFFQDVLNWPDRLDADLQVLYGQVNEATQGLTKGMRERFADLEADWTAAMDRRDAVIDGAIADFNAGFAEASAPGVALPPLGEPADDTDADGGAAPDGEEESDGEE